MLNIYYSYFQVTHRFTKKFIETIEEKKIWRQIVKFSNPLNPTLPIPHSSNQIEGLEKTKNFSYLSKWPDNQIKVMLHQFMVFANHRMLEFLYREQDFFFWPCSN